MNNVTEVLIFLRNNIFIREIIFQHSLACKTSIIENSNLY
jgi:hypothetical protein